MRILHLVTCLLLASSCLAAQRSRRIQPGSGPQPAPEPQLWVSGYNSNQVHRFSQNTGLVSGPGLGAPGAQSIVQGSDGFTYVVAEEQNAVLRFYGTRPSGPFVFDDPATPADETGGLDGPTAAIFGPDGALYVASFNGDSVLRYDGQTGEYLGVFVASRQNGLDGPDAGMRFGPDGHLYVPSFNSNEVLRYEGSTGADLGVFIPAFAGGLLQPRVLLFRPDGELWVSSFGSNELLAFDAAGNFRRRILRLRGLTGFAIGPKDGLLYVASSLSNRVARYDPFSGAFLDNFIPSGSDGIDAATFIAFVQPRR